MKERVLVTGGAGFIGTHLCQALRALGYPVRVLDLRGPEKAVAGVEYQRGDVRNSSFLAANLNAISAVFHLAAIASVPRCEAEPEAGISTNFDATVALLDQITHHQRKTRVIFPSSAAVYGAAGSSNQLLSESTKMLKPLSRYGFQKLESERALRFYHRQFGLQTVVFRLFNVFGPGQPADSSYSGVVTRFHAQVLAKEPLILHGDGKQTRDFVYVGDIITGMLLALDLPSSQCRGQAINLGSGRGISVRDLALSLARDLGVSVPIRESASRIADILHSTADIRRAKRLLRWTPRQTLSAGIASLLTERTSGRIAA